MTTENNSVLVTVETSGEKPAATTRFNLNSLLFGGYATAAVLAVYSLINLAGEIVGTLMPYVAGGILFVSLTAIFLSIISTLKKIRSHASKSFAVWDTYAAIAVLTVVGYFAAACVATFQPDGHAADLWTNGATAAILWGLLFGGGKYAGELFRDGGKS